MQAFTLSLPSILDRAAAHESDKVLKTKRVTKIFSSRAIRLSQVPPFNSPCRFLSDENARNDSKIIYSKKTPLFRVVSPEHNVFDNNTYQKHYVNKNIPHPPSASTGKIEKLRFLIKHDVDKNL
jgi:hypothetical protein